MSNWEPSLPRLLGGAGLWWAVAVGVTTTAIFSTASVSVNVIFVLGVWLGLSCTAILVTTALAHFPRWRRASIAALVASAGMLLALPVSGWTWAVEQDSLTASEAPSSDLTTILAASLTLTSTCTLVLVLIIGIGSGLVARARRAERNSESN